MGAKFRSPGLLRISWMETFQMLSIGQIPVFVIAVTYERRASARHLHALFANVLSGRNKPRRSFERREPRAPFIDPVVVY